MTFLLSFGCPLPATAQLTGAGCPQTQTKREPSALLYGYGDSNALIYDPYINGPFTYRLVPTTVGLENTLLQIHGLFCHLYPCDLQAEPKSGRGSEVGTMCFKKHTARQDLELLPAFL